MTRAHSAGRFKKKIAKIKYKHQFRIEWTETRDTRVFHDKQSGRSRYKFLAQVTFIDLYFYTLYMRKL